MQALDFRQILQCPACSGSLIAGSEEFECIKCKSRYPIVEGIPRLFAENNWSPDQNDVTSTIREFYEAVPFPDYESLDDAASLIDKARRGLLARLLDEQLPLGCQILEAGCGTGQLSNFLSIANRTVVGTDLSVSSLILAERFRRKNALNRVQFLQMNLFQPCFQNESFDVVVSNGVLHHTSDPKLAFVGLSRLLKPGGYLIVGLYHYYGRLVTDIRRTLFSLIGEKLMFLDSRAIDKSLGTNRRRAWFEDQYRNPHESKHTIREVSAWLEDSGLELIRSLPSTRWFAEADSDPNQLFEAESPGTGLAAALREMSMACWPGQIKEGGFFVVVARKHS